MSDAHFKRLAFVIAPVAVTLAGGLYLVARPSSPTPAPPASMNQCTQHTAMSLKLIEVLKNGFIFKNMFPEVLAYWQSWYELGEQKLLVFPHQVVGTTKYNTSEEGQRAAQKLSAAMKDSQPKPSIEFAYLLSEGVRRDPLFLQSDLISFSDDNS